MNFWQSLERPVIGLSPMDGVTDAAFRLTVTLQGKPDVSFTEFTHVHDVCRGPEFLLDSLLYDEAERPIVAQLYGKNPDLFYQAAHVVCELGFDGLDVNMGCPSRNVASSGSGAGLIRTPELAQAILEATRQGIADWAGGQSLEAAGIKPARAEMIRRMSRRDGGVAATGRRVIPLSVKTRIGYDEVIVERWVEWLLRVSPAAISLHGRTLQQMYRGASDWQAIARAVTVARGSGTLLFGNGDVQSLRDVVRRVRETGVDGVLVGRAIQGAPWFFAQKREARRAVATPEAAGPQPDDRSLEARFAVMLDHARLFERRWGPSQFRRMRKHLGWYCKGFPHAAALRARMFQVSSLAEVQAAIDSYRTAPVSDASEEDISLLEESIDETSPASRCS